MGRLLATIGNESHTTSSYWMKVSVNGKAMRHGDAISKRWISKYGDKHASWCECVFEVNDGDTVSINAGSNTGNRGANRDRQMDEFVFDSTLEPVEVATTGGLGSVVGRLRLKVDALAEAAKAHHDLAEEL